MCGIIGFFPFNNNNVKTDDLVKAVIQRFLFVESLVYMQPRGKDSTGISLLWDDNNTTVLKQPVPAEKFSRDDGLWGDDFRNPDDKNAHFNVIIDKWLREWPDVKLKHALGHVRAKTVGSEYNPHNNHPIIISKHDFSKGGPLSLGSANEHETIIGVHNGGIKNADEIFKKHKFDRIGQVDSEALFQLIFEKRNNLNTETLTEIYEELRGAWAALAYNPSKPDVVVGLREVERPLDAIFIKEISTLALISEKKFLDNALLQYDRWRIREASTVFSIITDKNEKIELGKIRDVFPYLSLVNETSLTPGVFMLDLSQEVDSSTVKIGDLVRITPVAKKTTVATPTHPYKDTRAASTTPASTTPAATTPSVAPTPLPAANNQEDKKTHNDATVVTDLSTYEKMEHPVDEVIKSLSADENQELEISGIVEIEDGDIIDIPDGDCPYSFDMLKSAGKDHLYSNVTEENCELIINKVDEMDVREFLSKNLVNVSNEHDAVALLAGFYDIIYPEGYAHGFAAGYKSSSDDYDYAIDQEDSQVDELLKKIARLEAELKAKDGALNNLASKTTELIACKNKDDLMKKRMAAVLRELFKRDGVFKEDNTLDVEVMKSLQAKLNFKRPSLLGVVAKAMSKTENK